MDPKYREKLQEQGYAFAGEHTAVKTCGWTKKSLRDEGTCYKETFYGIKAHRCVQMTPAVNFCDHDCVFCWRERNNSGFGKLDEPGAIIDGCIAAQRKLLSGFGGLNKANKEKFKEAQDPLHFAISLNGEVTYYPKLSELVKQLEERGLTSFVVTNGQLPDVLRKMHPPTQLYLSLDAPNEERYKKIDRPMRHDGWARVLDSLAVLRERRDETRTTIRVTLIKGMNDTAPEEWAELIERARPHFVEVKAYMFIGASRQRLTIGNMPYHDDVKAFANEIAKHCGYVIVDEHEKSRVVLMMREEEKEAEWRMMDFSNNEVKNNAND